MKHVGGHLTLLGAFGLALCALWVLLRWIAAMVSAGRVIEACAVASFVLLLAGVVLVASRKARQ